MLAVGVGEFEKVVGLRRGRVSDIENYRVGSLDAEELFGIAHVMGINPVVLGKQIDLPHAYQFAQEMNYDICGRLAVALDKMTAEEQGVFTRFVDHAISDCSDVIRKMEFICEQQHPESSGTPCQLKQNCYRKTEKRQGSLK